MIRILISACLCGQPVRYDGKDVPVANSILAEWRDDGRLLPLCPELAGGLPVPRRPAEIPDGHGATVLTGESRVLEDTGEDVTGPFLAGARAALSLAQSRGAELAILTEGSPSCGTGFIYDGSFSGARRSGMGVTAALLESNGIRVFSQHRIDEAAQYLQELEAVRRRVPE